MHAQTSNPAQLSPLSFLFARYVAGQIEDGSWNAFMDAGDAFDGDVAGRLRENIFGRGNTIDPAEGYRAFRGRDPDIGALLEKRGFA